MATDTTATNNKDTLLNSAAVTTNYGTLNVSYVQNGGGQILNTLINFTLPAGSGSISSIRLYLYVTTLFTGTFTVKVHQLTQAWTEAGATWNTYDGTNNWASPGGDYSATVVDTAAAPASGNWFYLDLSTGADNPIAGLTWGGTVDLIVRTDAQGDSRNIEIATKEHATSSIRPYIEITYSTAGDTGILTTKTGYWGDI